MEVVKALSYQNKVLGGSIAFFVVMVIFAGWAWAVVRKNKHRWATYVYSFFLALVAGMSIYIALKAPQARRKSIKGV
jgi:hypothetical protein